jgi:hypothetical protein
MFGPVPGLLIAGLAPQRKSAVMAAELRRVAYIIRDIVFPAVPPEDPRSLVPLAEVFPALRGSVVALIGKTLDKPVDCALVFAAECGARRFAAATARARPVRLAENPYLRQAMLAAAKANLRADFATWLGAAFPAQKGEVGDPKTFLLEACREESSATLRWLVALLPEKRVSKRLKQQGLQYLVGLSGRGTPRHFRNVVATLGLAGRSDLRGVCARCFVEAFARDNRELALALDGEWRFGVDEIARDGFRCFRQAALAGRQRDVEWLLGRFRLEERRDFLGSAVPSTLRQVIREGGDEEIAWFLIKRFGIPKEEFAERLVARVLLAGDLPRAERLIAEFGVGREALLERVGNVFLSVCAERGRPDMLSWLVANFKFRRPELHFRPYTVEQAFFNCLPGRTEMARAIADFCHFPEEERRRLAAQAVRSGRRREGWPDLFEPVIAAFGVTKKDLLGRYLFSASWPLSEKDQRAFEWYIRRFDVGKGDLLQLENRALFGLLYSAHPGKAAAWFLRRFGVTLPEVEELARRMFALFGARVGLPPGEARERVCAALRQEYAKFGPDFAALPYSSPAVDEPDWIGKPGIYLGCCADTPARLLRSAAATPKIGAAWLLLLDARWSATEELCVALEAVKCADEK